jgi:hypothetical protein
MAPGDGKITAMRNLEIALSNLAEHVAVSRPN